MRIGEVAKRTGVSVRMVRYYDQQGYLNGQREAGGKHRRFDDDDVHQLLLLRSMLTAGVSPSMAGRVVAGSAPEEELREADQALARSAEQTRTARARLAAAQRVPVERQLSLAFDLFMARTQMESLLSLELQPAGISSADYAVLSLVSLERLTPVGLARIVGVAPSTLARRVRALIDKGWLSRSADPADARSWVLEVTAAGEERIDLALPLARRLFRRLDEALLADGLDPQVLRSELHVFSAVVRSLLPT